MSIGDALFVPIMTVIMAMVVALIWGFVVEEFFKSVKMPFSKIFNKKVQTYMWFFLGVTAYFTLGHIYASWLVYAHANPASLASRILGPWPMGLIRNPQDDEWIFLLISAPFIFLVSWIVAIAANIGYFLFWIMFGG
ncbi:hypothetical protein KGQ34_04000, partial [Patescibacteria group bacterium]|nr:hypothetical protein [Patescibacteria group bacterium]